MSLEPLHADRRRWMLRGASLAGASFAGASLLAAPRPAAAAIGGLPSNVAHDASSPEWETLRTRLFGTRPITAGADSHLQLIVPLRAAFGASVPVKVVSRIPQTRELQVKKLTLLVDKNPSPVAATIAFGIDAGQADLETRIRVNEYSHVRVIAELSNGELHMDSRYAKVSGGCSAPSNRQPVDGIGRTVLRIVQDDAPPTHPPAATSPMGSLMAADVTVAHPNDTGFELNERTLLFIPAYFVRTLKLSYSGQVIFDAELDFSISENPSFRFNFVPKERGELRAEVLDSKDLRYVGRLAVG
jgi:sulfur-oxidizing protein SoxY